MKSLSERDLEDLGDERFEDLVAALVLRKHPGADHLGAPDGGADVLLEHSPGKPKVWQVKHYPKQINWSECESSLDAAVENFEPSEVVFVFPRRITTPLKETFARRLRGRHEGVEVSHISGPQILDRLRDPDNEDLIREFFDRDPDELAREVAERVGAEFTLPPRDPELEQLARIRQGALRDRRFDSQVYTSVGEAPEPEWDEAPYIVTSAGSPNVSVTVASWAAKGAEVEFPSLYFTDDEAGERARREARARIARGEEARLREGVGLRLAMPEAAKAALPDDFEGWDSGELRIQPKSSRWARIMADHHGATVERELNVFQVPPPPLEGDERVLSFGGVERGLEFFMDLYLDRKPRVRACFNVSLDQAAERSDWVEAARLLLALLDGRAGMSSDLLPDGENRPQFDPSAIDDQQIQWLRTMVKLEDALVTIHELAGVELEAPDPVPVEDVASAISVAEILRERKGSLKLSNLSGTVPVEESAKFLARHSKSSTARLPLKIPVFGTTIGLGIAEGDIPQPDLVIPGTAIDGQKRFEVRWTTPADFEFDLVDYAP